jgi:hypothetical protein
MAWYEACGCFSLLAIKSFYSFDWFWREAYLADTQGASQGIWAGALARSQAELKGRV